MMTGIQLPGLATGLDSTSIINSYMQMYSQPKIVLQNRVSADNDTISSLQTLNNLVSGLATNAQSWAASGSLQDFTVTSSAPGITATADGDAVAGSLSVSIDQLATSQVMVTGAYTAWPDDPPTLTFVASDGTQTEVTAASTNLDDVVSAINGSGAGVTAQKVAVGTDPSGATEYRLQLSSQKTGADGAFQVYQSSAAEVGAGTAADLSTTPGAVVISQAQDAQATLWAGTPAAQTITSDSNTFTDLLPGVDVTASAVTSGPATITVGQDTATASKTAGDMVTALSNIFQYVANGQATTSSTDPDSGDVTTVMGPLTGDSDVRSADEMLLTAATDPVGGVSPSSIGITITKDGTVTFDADKFSEAMAADPAQVQKMFSTIASRIQSAATTISDPYSGTISQEITNQQAAVSDLNDQIDSMNTLLAAQQQSLQNVFAQLETTVGQLNSQGSYLQSQLDALTASATKK